MAIIVSEAVHEGLTAAKVSGAHNMFDRPAVINWLIDNGFDEAADWVIYHKEEYSEGIFHGFEIEH